MSNLSKLIARPHSKTPYWLLVVGRSLLFFLKPLGIAIVIVPAIAVWLLGTLILEFLYEVIPEKVKRHESIL
jgi:uncharacterized membrane protein